MNQQGPVEIDDFSDLLCVWAFVAEARLDELHSAFGDGIRNGRARAALAPNERVRQRHRIESSPSFVLNEGRQVLEFMREPGAGAATRC